MPTGAVRMHGEQGGWISLPTGAMMTPMVMGGKHCPRAPMRLGKLGVPRAFTWTAESQCSDVPTAAQRRPPLPTSHSRLCAGACFTSESVSFFTAEFRLSLYL
jgi:hypothetical protein